MAYNRPCKCTPTAPGTITFTYDDAVVGNVVVAACNKCSTSSQALKIQSGFQP